MAKELLASSDTFPRRHIGPTDVEIDDMLAVVGVESLAALVDATVPADIRAGAPLSLPAARTEREVIADAADIAAKNQVFRSFIGMGYYDCITPAVIQRNVLENPGWYTPYTPYQAEISQGRLEALINFQTVVTDLTALPLANASLLDEATAAAEAMTMCRAASRGKRSRFFAADDCHPQTLAVLETRASALGVELTVGPVAEFSTEGTGSDLAGVLIQYPTTHGRLLDYSGLAVRVHEAGGLFVVATDLLALTLLRPPGEFGADIAVGSSQRFGVPMAGGGPHAAFLASREEYKRQIPGRIVGVSHDAAGRPAYRLALQTREQHIRRDRATSNICTAQALLAVMASMYAVYHGPAGLRRIARRVHGWAEILARGLGKLGFEVGSGPFFDTVRVATDAETASRVVRAAEARRMNLRRFPAEPGGVQALGISVDETTTERDVGDLLACFGEGAAADADAASLVAELVAAADDAGFGFPTPLARTSEFLTHDTFHLYHSEHELLRYLFRLQERDIGLTRSMIPLGSCTMKLNGTTEMVPITWTNFARIHPYAPVEQLAGYEELTSQLATWLGEVTGLASVSLQPNSGAQGEFAGLLAIRGYYRARGDDARTVCMIPTSAHGTNPASAVMAGFDVVAVQCDDHGNIDLADLAAKAEKYSDRLAALMVTYPSTHGVFETAIREICATVHRFGGQVYMDGANLNAQLGLCRPGDYGVDVCHLNLHKTFCIPHGGGGPGMGPIACADHLARHLPRDPVEGTAGPPHSDDRTAGPPHADDRTAGPSRSIDRTDAPAGGPVAAARYGSPGILPISWAYIALMGADGLTRATGVAVLAANYMACRLREHYDILYTGPRGRVAHEFVVDCRPFKKLAGVEVHDIAKRLMDFGFHAPTMSWPVPGTLMIEPTESESKAELDRLCDAMIAIRDEIRAIAEGELDRDDNPLKHAPHTAEEVCGDSWDHAYGREQAVYPLPWVRRWKYWPPVSRIDNAYGDRNLVCTCPSVEDLAEP